MTIIASSGASCSLHKTHHPLPTYCELHHIIPQAWQVLYVPSTFTGAPDGVWPYAGPSPDRQGVMLWDARTDPLCRTGHGNTHWYLVKIMHFMSERPALSTADQLDYAITNLRHSWSHTDPATVREAVQALMRFGEAQGSLPLLWAHDEWGEI